MNNLRRKQINDLKVLVKFTQVNCQAKHHTAKVQTEIPQTLQQSFRNGVQLCPDCHDFLTYALQKLAKCPLDPKPSCKHCKIHCYSAVYRQKAKEIMAFSGRRLILQGRLDYLWHYFF